MLGLYNFPFDLCLAVGCRDDGDGEEESGGYCYRAQRRQLGHHRMAIISLSKIFIGRVFEATVVGGSARVDVGRGSERQG